MILYAIAVGALNIALCLLLGPYFEGMSRKYVKANIAHSRVGPLTGPLQPFIDLLKLFGKEDLETGGFLQRFAPILAMGAVLMCALLTPMGGPAPFEFGGDFIVLLYFLGLISVAIVMGSIAGGSSYTMSGGLREVMGLLLIDIAMAVAFITVMVNTRSMRISDWVVWQSAAGPNFSMVLAGIPILLLLPAQFGKLPFDTPEADQELMGGPFADMSGRKLALFKWALLAKGFVVASLFVQVFVPWPVTPWFAANLAIHVAKVLVVFVLVGVGEALFPRLRIDQALRYYAMLFVIGAMAVVLAYLSA